MTQITVAPVSESRSLASRIYNRNHNNNEPWCHEGLKLSASVADQAATTRVNIFAFAITITAADIGAGAGDIVNLRASWTNTAVQVATPSASCRPSASARCCCAPSSVSFPRSTFYTRWRCPCCPMRPSFQDRVRGGRRTAMQVMSRNRNFLTASLVLNQL